MNFHRSQMLSALPLGEPIPCRGDAPEEQLDLHAALVPNPVCTFYMRVSGHRMRDHGVHDGDLVVIDRSVEPDSGSVVVVAHQGVFLMRPLLRQGEQWLLQPLRASEVAIALDLEADDRSGLFGVVMHVVHHLDGRAESIHGQGRGRSTSQAIKRMPPVLTTVKIQSA